MAATIERTSTTLEANRTYDLDISNWGETSSSGEIEFAFGTKPRKVTGVLKAVNRYIKLLLTRKESDPFNKEEGTYFDDLLYMGGSSVSELTTFIGIQVSDALGQVKLIQSQYSFPKDENISNAEVIEVIYLSKEKIRVRVLLSTEAGQTVIVKIPNIGG